MSRRLKTVLRVAALQETVAKAAAGRATADALRAEQARDAATAALAGHRLTGRQSAASLAHAAQARTLAAGVVQQAEGEVGAREQDRLAAVGGWTAARARVRLFEELDSRQREERRQEVERAAQRLADDLSAGRAEERR